MSTTCKTRRNGKRKTEYLSTELVHVDGFSSDIVDFKIVKFRWSPSLWRHFSKQALPRGSGFVYTGFKCKVYCDHSLRKFNTAITYSLLREEFLNISLHLRGLIMSGKAMWVDTALTVNKELCIIPFDRIDEESWSSLL